VLARFPSRSLLTPETAPALLIVAAVFVADGCVRPEPEPRSLRIFAAASLTDVVELLVAQYDDATVSTTFGGSSALARQIRDGAPADVFLSASPQWIDFLREADALEGEPIVLARHRLVAIAPKGSPLAATDPRSLSGQLEAGARVAIADEGVPAGEYARAALEHYGLLDEYQPRLVGQSDVRAVLHAVEQGELQAGFVYSTDAAIADVEVLFVFDAGAHPPIEYQAAVVSRASSVAAAQRFLTYLESEPARSVLTDAGFALAPASTGAD
jgi:molybdate transport system substrate-binding protein